jgi:hypothetical protein
LSMFWISAKSTWLRWSRRVSGTWD